MLFLKLNILDIPNRMPFHRLHIRAYMHTYINYSQTIMDKMPVLSDTIFILVLLLWTRRMSITSSVSMSLKTDPFFCRSKKINHVAYFQVIQNLPVLLLLRTPTTFCLFPKLAEPTFFFTAVNAKNVNHVDLIACFQRGQKHFKIKGRLFNKRHQKSEGFAVVCLIWLYVFQFIPIEDILRDKFLQKPPLSVDDVTQVFTMLSYQICMTSIEFKSFYQKKISKVYKKLFHQNLNIFHRYYSLQALILCGAHMWIFLLTTTYS